MCPMKVFLVSAQSCCANFSLLTLRLIAGSAFVIHGWGKIQTPFTWMGPDAFAPGVLQALAAFSEFGGGIAWILGLLVPLASFGMFCTMAVATFMHLGMRGDPFVAVTGGPSAEPALVYLGVAIVFMFVGPGKISLDYKLFGSRKNCCGTSACACGVDSQVL